MGTAGYMAPEQALGQSVDPRADMYAFGVVLYEMVAGKMPYVAEEAAQILAKQLTEPPAPLPGGAPAGLSSLIFKLLEKTPDDRVQNAAELSGEVARLRSSLATAGPSTVLDVDGGGLPKSARTARSTDDSAATLDVAEGKKTEESTDPSRRRRVLAAAAVLAAVLGAAVFWGTRNGETPTTPFTLSSATAALLSSLPPLPAVVPSASAEPEEPAPSAASRTEGPGTAPTSSSSTRTTFSESKSTKTDGNTTTTKRTTKKSTVTEKRTVERKRRTGPGGIYIPPPNQWFK
jgi:serine/threonine-protein kinase